MTEVVIVAAKRTAVGSFLGGLSGLSAAQLGEYVIKNIIEETGIDPKEVCEVFMGQVLTANCGQNPARQASYNAGLPKETPAITINQVCGSGLRAVALGAQAVLTGDSQVVIAGGQESMSNAPHACVIRTGQKMGNASMVDTMVNDGLWDIFNNYHMGITAENIAKEFKISREEQDEFALASQQKAVAAQEAGKFKDEIVPVTIKHRKGDIVINADEGPRKDASIESMQKLRPAFDKEGSVTAGNASSLNDGAAAVMLMSAEKAAALGLNPIARITSWAHAGVDPKIMGTGPVPASEKALAKAGWSKDDLDLVEANEAFAAQALYVNKNMRWDVDKVNVNGGAIAIGHPIGASGARVLTTLLHEMKRSNAKKGLATMCIGGGMGIAMCVEGGV